MLTLVVLDGFGIGKNDAGNAVTLAGTPHIDSLAKKYNYATIKASGLAVGIDDGQMGNSECGHINMGAGRVVKQNSVRIDELIESGELSENQTLCDAVEHVKKFNSNLHIMGLYSKGGVHSKISQANAIIDFCISSGIKTIYFHAFTDGRDRPVCEGKEEILALLNSRPEVKIASVCGRVWAMDRENRWDRVEKAYNSLTMQGECNTSSSVEKYFDDNYNAGVYDEFLPPVVFPDGKPIKDNDAVVFFNFRTDRPRELTEAFTEDSFSAFKREKIDNLFFATMTRYSNDLKNIRVVIENENPTPSLGAVLEQNGKSQFRISETTKYAHVTFFFNGEREEPFVGESRVLIPTRDVLSFDEYPEMRAEEITEDLTNAIKQKKYDFLLANITNCDMVGHTGNLEAAKKAVKTVDECVQKIADACVMTKSDLIVTADHGNIEEMLKNGEKQTAHTTNDVPVIYVPANGEKMSLKSGLPLSTISTSVLKIMGINIPDYMTTPTFL